jgi:protease-4
MRPNTIAVLNIMTEISYASDRSSFLNREGALYWIEMLKAAENNPNIKAVILRINSPGGSVAATQEVYEAVKRLKAAGKVVVASFGDVAASGAYYIASAADKIVANPGTLTGSIGVVISGYQFSGIMEEYGIAVNVIKSGDYKDIMSPYRPMTDGEKRIMQSIVMDTWRQFVDSVAEGRKMDVGKVEKLADGRIYGAIQALDAGLIDELGDFRKPSTSPQSLQGSRASLTLSS